MLTLLGCNYIYILVVVSFPGHSHFFNVGGCFSASNIEKKWEWPGNKAILVVYVAHSVVQNASTLLYDARDCLFRGKQEILQVSVTVTKTPRYAAVTIHAGKLDFQRLPEAFWGKDSLPPTTTDMLRLCELYSDRQNDTREVDIMVMKMTTD